MTIMKVFVQLRPVRPRGEEFLRISLCPYSASNPHSPEPCFFTDQNFYNIFEKGKNLTSRFREEECLDFLFFVPMFKQVTPRAGPVLTPGAAYEQTW